MKSNKIKNSKISLFVFLLSLNFFANAWSPFGPSDFEDCAKKAAQEAKSNNALSILVAQCGTEFPARRARSGGYEYFDTVTMQSISVSDPKLSTADRTKITRHQEATVQARAEIYRIQEIKNNQAIPKVNITKWNIGCANSYYCHEKIISAVIKNGSPYSISKIGVGIVVNRKIDSCGILSESSSATVSIPPGRSATVNFHTWDGPTDGGYQACFGVTSVTAD
ncbi:MAG: hypothetical protein RIQ69_416 [Pseudomonadota bacterium]|jgi:hypothetical protein